MTSLRITAAFILLVSGILHILQPVFNPADGSTVGMAVFGVLFVITGALLFIDKRIFMLIGSIVPAVGAVIGTLDHFTSLTPLPIFWLFLVLDVAVVPLCFSLYVRKPA